MLPLPRRRPKRPRDGVARGRGNDADGPAWPAPISAASYTCTAVKQRIGTGYAAPRTGLVGGDGS